MALPSVSVKRKQPVPVVRRTTIPGEGYPDESNSDSHGTRFHEDRRYPGRRRYYQERGGRPLVEKTTRVKVIQEEEDPLMVEDPLMMEDP